MGSLYDIGNFRYKHFTFYSHCGDDCKDFTTNAIADKEIKKFLNAVWPFRGRWIGDSSEGDYAFVTYVKQYEERTPGNEYGMIKQKIDKIYVYTRMSLGAENPQWVQAYDPGENGEQHLKTLEPQQIIQS